MGANDITNSAAVDDPLCAIAGMPVIEVWRAKKVRYHLDVSKIKKIKSYRNFDCLVIESKVIFCKRSMGGGYADLENPVFFKDNTDMLLGNAKNTCDEVATKFKEIMEVV